MKLSKKGAEKISTNCKNVTVIGTDDFFPPTILEGADKLEFDQSDFTGAVVLSVDDAEEIARYLWDTVGTISVSKKRGKAIDSFIKKAWQATVTK